MNSLFILHFYLKKPKNYKNGPIPVYARITVNLLRAEMSAGKSCDPERWHNRLGRVTGIKEEARQINAHLETLTNKIHYASQLLFDTGQPVTAESIRDKMIGKPEKRKFLMELFAEHNARVKALLGNGFEPNTLKGYKTSVRHLTAFLSHKYGKKDIDIRNLNHAFIVDFDFYLKSVCKCSGVSSAKYIKHLKKIVNHCLVNNWLPVNPFKAYKATIKVNTRVILSEEELKRIINKKFTIERLCQVRDILFSVVSLAYPTQTSRN